MKIVNKYELAKLPNGTFFYELRVTKDANNNIEYDIFNGTLNILDGSKNNFIYDEPFFNGITYLTPDLYKDDSSNGGFIKEKDLEWLNKRDFELFNVDTDSNDFNTENKFLVLEKEDVKALLFILTNYYRKGYGEVSNERL